MEINLILLDQLTCFGSFFHKHDLFALIGLSLISTNMKGKFKEVNIHTYKTLYRVKHIAKYFSWYEYKPETN